MNGSCLSLHLKETFIKVMEKVAKAYPPITTSEKEVLDKFIADIVPIHGDTLYYNGK